MKTTILFLRTAILIFCSFFFARENLSAQNANLLYGVTSKGGIDGAGIIFHIDKTNASQTVDHSFIAEPNGSNPWGDLTD